MDKWQAYRRAPQWLHTFVGGLSNRYHWTVAIDHGGRFAIGRQAGHTAYIDRMSGSRYCAAEYWLIEKGSGYTWGFNLGASRQVWEGRLTKAARAELDRLLKEADRIPPTNIDEAREA